MFIKYLFLFLILTITIASISARSMESRLRKNLLNDYEIDLRCEIFNNF